MKRETKNAKMAESKMSLQDTLPEDNQLIQKYGLNKLMVSNHLCFGVSEGIFCNSPPGQARSPGSSFRLSPVERTDAHAEGNQLLCFDIQNFKQNKTINIYNHLIFTIMKKQILFLMFFVLVFITSITNVFAQPQDHLTTALSTCPTVTAVTCLTPDALHPIPGTAYDYTVTVPTPVGSSPTFKWFVTQDQEFVKASAITATAEANDGTGLHIAATGTGYNDPLTGKATINMTWKGFTKDDAKPVFLVIYVQNPATCSNDNMQVYIIEPLHAFTLDVANVGLDGLTHPTDWDGPCAAPVASAKYDVGTKTVLMNYGINYLYFAVTAANYTGAWKPSFQVTSTTINATGGRKVNAVDWTYPTTSISTTATDWHGTTLTGTDYISTDVVKAQATNKTVGASGECIVVRVTVDNGNIETLTPEPIAFAADGITMTESVVASGNYDANGLGDIDATDCTTDLFKNDVVNQNIMPRPDIVDGITPPASTTFIPKN